MSPLPRAVPNGKKLLVKHMIERMAQAYGVNRCELSGHTKISASTYNDWVLEGVIPYQALHRCHLTTGVSLDWLYHGEHFQNRLTVSELNQLHQLFSLLIDDALEEQLLQQVQPGAIDFIIKRCEQKLLNWGELNSQHQKMII